MLFERGMSVRDKRPEMGRDSLALKEGFHRGGRKPYIEFFPNEPKRYAVVVAVDLDMVVDIDGGHSPFGILIGCLRKGACVGTVKQIKKLAARLFHLAKPPAV